MYRMCGLTSVISRASLSSKEFLQLTYPFGGELGG